MVESGVLWTAVLEGGRDGGSQLPAVRGSVSQACTIRSNINGLGLILMSILMSIMGS